MSAINDDLHINGTLTAALFKAPSGSITDDSVIGGAGIKYTKVQQGRKQVYSQPNTAAAAETKGLGVILGATGLLVDFRAGCVGPCVGADTITVDLRKNGVSVLTSPITLNSSQAAYALIAGALAVTALVATDVFTVVVTPNHSSGTLGTGVFAVANWAEDPQ